MYCAIPRTVCQMQSWKRPVDCTTSETRTVNGGSKPNENLIPEKVYYPSVEAAVPGQEAVLSALGVRKLRKNTILSDGTKNLIRAMERHGVKRLVCESSLGVGDSQGQLGWVY